jgi:hypothetical protein
METANQEQDAEQLKRGLAELWRKETILKHFVWSYPLFATIFALFIALKTNLGDPSGAVVIIYLIALVGLAVWVIGTPCPRCAKPALSSKTQSFQKDGCCQNCGLNLRKPKDRRRDMITLAVIVGCYLILLVSVLVLQSNFGFA